MRPGFIFGPVNAGEVDPRSGKNWQTENPRLPFGYDPECTHISPFIALTVTDGDVVDIVVTGAEEFATLARRLKGAPADLRRELYAGLNRATKPLKQSAKASAAARLPHRGGLAQRVAGSRLATRRRAQTGIRIEAKGMQQLALIDRGMVRHPVYGRGRWVNQSITPGWFTLPMEVGAPLVRAELVEAIRKTAAKIEAGI